ncbi:MAG: trypsin-like peptidase domain-containing protein [Symploca sp. SIO1B1]|nr:trypsin-like peptidase domain-containing protein [Symploca sp. SIO1B1]
MLAQLNYPVAQSIQRQNRLSEVQLQNIAHKITVKVVLEQAMGSGVLIHRQEDFTHTVVTNAHVLRPGISVYKVQTSDGLIHEAQWIESYRFQGDDLAILQFRSPEVGYEVALLKPAFTFLARDAEVFAGGYPLLTNQSTLSEFVFKSGKVSVLLHQRMEGGYQVGYSIDISQGMSGGPLNLSQLYPLVIINTIAVDISGFSHRLLYSFRGDW